MSNFSCDKNIYPSVISGPTVYQTPTVYNIGAGGGGGGSFLTLCNNFENGCDVPVNGYKSFANTNSNIELSFLANGYSFKFNSGNAEVPFWCGIPISQLFKNSKFRIKCSFKTTYRTLCIYILGGNVRLENFDNGLNSNIRNYIGIEYIGSNTYDTNSTHTYNNGTQHLVGFIPYTSDVVEFQFSIVDGVFYLEKDGVYLQINDVNKMGNNGCLTLRNNSSSSDVNSIIEVYEIEANWE